MEIQAQALTIRTDYTLPGQTRPLCFSSRKTVQQVLVETYLLYRKMFWKGMLTYNEYFGILNCIKR